MLSISPVQFQKLGESLPKDIAEVCDGHVVVFPVICHPYIPNIFYVTYVLEDIATQYWSTCLP